MPIRIPPSGCSAVPFPNSQILCVPTPLDESADADGPATAPLIPSRRANPNAAHISVPEAPKPSAPSTNRSPDLCSAEAGVAAATTEPASTDDSPGGSTNASLRAAVSAPELAADIEADAELCPEPVPDLVADFDAPRPGAPATPESGPRDDLGYESVCADRECSVGDFAPPTREEPADPDVSADATPDNPAITPPIPNTAAKTPIRPTYLDADTPGRNCATIAAETGRNMRSVMRPDP